MKRILFVDDEMPVLDGLRNALRAQRKDWDMVFACGGEAGLQHIDAGAFDVVVSDMRMPKVDGAALLARVRDRQPQALRIVLSGQTDIEPAMRTVFTAHQFLTKPCEAESVRLVINRALELNQVLQSPSLRATVGQIAALPSPPGVYLALRQALANPSASLQDVALIIERDVALTAKILQLVNSAFFGLPRKISSVLQAATFLGAATLSNLALAMETFASAGRHVESAKLEELQRHALLTAQLSSRLMTGNKQRADQAFVAGVLHDIGSLFDPSPVPDDNDADEADGVAVGHATIGAYLLSLWGLPHPVVEAVAFHDNPARSPHEGFEVMDAVYLADQITSRARSGTGGRSPSRALDFEYLGRRGWSEAKIAGLTAEAGEAGAAA